MRETAARDEALHQIALGRLDVRLVRRMPKPVQRPRPPIWVAGASEAALRRTARYADVFHPVRPSYEYLARCRTDLDRMLEEEGRKPSDVGLAVKTPIVFRDEPLPRGMSGKVLKRELRTEYEDPSSRGPAVH